MVIRDECQRVLFALNAEFGPQLAPGRRHLFLQMLFVGKVEGEPTDPGDLHTWDRRIQPMHDRPVLARLIVKQRYSSFNFKFPPTTLSTGTIM